jgi:hypothetical protein
MGLFKHEIAIAQRLAQSDQKLVRPTQNIIPHKEKISFKWLQLKLDLIVRATLTIKKRGMSFIEDSRHRDRGRNLGAMEDSGL